MSLSVEELWELWEDGTINILRLDDNNIHYDMKQSPHSLKKWVLDTLANINVESIKQFSHFTRPSISLYGIQNEIYECLINKKMDISLDDFADIIFKVGIMNKYVCSINSLSDKTFNDLLYKFKDDYGRSYIKDIQKDPRFSSYHIEQLIHKVINDKDYITDLTPLFYNPNYISPENMYKIINYYKNRRTSIFWIDDSTLFHSPNSTFDMIYDVLSFNKEKNNHMLRNVLNSSTKKKLLSMSPLQIHLLAKIRPDIYQYTDNSHNIQLNISIDALEPNNE